VHHRDDPEAGQGLDPDLADNCRAVCRQDYPVYQVIFGVADPQDPAIPLLQSVLAESPGERHRLVIGPGGSWAEPQGQPAATDAPFAAHEIVVISDSDVRVGPEYLAIAPLPRRDGRVGHLPLPR
jgi:ceramide glucosyltransferase